MRRSIRRLSVLLAVFVSFLIVQSVQASELTGTVDSVDQNSIVLSLDDGSQITVSSLGPKTYWESQGFEYPVVGDILYLDVYEGHLHCIPIEVCYVDANVDNSCIALRDPDTLIPLWLGFQTDETTALSTVTSDCPNCPDCEPDLNLYDHNYDHNNDYLYGGPGPHR
jgi:hypothetical protein